MKHKLQNIGSGLIVAAYIVLLLKLKYVTWTALTLAGIIELVLIWKYDTTITAYVRSLCDKRVDTIIMLSLIPLTWWFAGPLAAGFFFIGFLVNHFGEKQ